MNRLSEFPSGQAMSAEIYLSFFSYCIYVFLSSRKTIEFNFLFLGLLAVNHGLLLVSSWLLDCKGEYSSRGSYIFSVNFFF